MRIFQGVTRTGFTVIELLIVVTIIGIILTAVIFIINPFHVFRKSHDVTRSTEVRELNKAISIFELDNPSGYLGDPRIVYISIPDPNATSSAGTDCKGIELPPLTGSNSRYHCPSLAAARYTDGTGWLPLPLNSLSGGSPFSALPIDPQNTSHTAFYQYSTDGARGTVILVKGENFDATGGLGGEFGAIMAIGAVVTVGFIVILSVILSLY